MGVYYRGRCYSDLDSGNSALFSDSGVAVSPDSISYFEYNSGAWRYVVGRIVDNSMSYSYYPSPSISYYQCNPADSVVDGVALGFLVMGVWVSAWCINVLRKTIGY